MNPAESAADPAPPGPMSRTAVLAAMFAVPCCCPPMSLLACVTGAVALWQMRADAALRGRWLAWTSIVVGAVSAVAMTLMLWQSGLGIVLRGPEPPLLALMRADPAAMREQWSGPAANLDAGALRSFADTVRERYGEFRSAQPSASRPLPLKAPAGKPVVSVPTTLRFERASVEADLGLELFDQRTRQGVIRWRSLRIVDPALGDLLFPAGEAPPPPLSADPLPNPAARPAPGAAPSPPAPSALR